MGIAKDLRALEDAAATGTGRTIEAREARKGMVLRRVTDRGTGIEIETVEVLSDAEEWGDKYAALRLRVIEYSGPYAGEIWAQPGREYSDGECRRWTEFEVIKAA